jgi:hypothetical protein
MTPIEALKAAAERGLTLSINGNKLRVTPGERLTAGFAQMLKEHKWHLLSILRCPFVMVYSEVLKETIFFAENEDTKDALVEAGADTWSIYTKDEVRVLVAQNRAEPFLPDELCKLHEIKRTFTGRIAN